MIGRTLAILLLGCLSADMRAGEPDLETIKRGKSATAFVEIEANGTRGSASAFCIDASGIFVTSYHVLEKVPRPCKLNLVLRAGMTDQILLPATLIRSDKVADLALLKVDNAKELIPLEVGSADNLIETTPLVAFGYPFGRLLAGGKEEYPSITVSTGRITSLRRMGGALHRIQLDANLNPGNSGGPLLDEQGKVVGIVASGIVGTGVNFAVPSSCLTRLLQKPDISMTIPDLTPLNLATPQEFTCKIISLIKPKDRLKATLTLTCDGETPREFQGEPDDKSVFHFKAVRIIERTPDKRLRVTARFSGGSITGVTPDINCKAADREIHLSEVTRIETTPEVRLALASGGTLAGPLSGLDAVELVLGEVACKVNLQKAATATIDDLSAASPSCSYKLAVYDGKSLLDEQAGMLSITRPGGVAVTGVQEPTPLASAKEIVRLPAAVDNIIAGGNGRFLILQFKKLAKLAIFDVSTGKVARFISIPSGETLIAAGSSKLIVVLPGWNIIQRWDLASGERELSLPLPDEIKGAQIAMGWASEGPLMTSNAVLLDLQTLRPLPFEHDRTGHSQMDRTAQVRASADGSAFGFWRTHSTPSGLSVARVVGNKVTWRYEHSSVGTVVPSMDGSLVMTCRGVIKPESINLMSDQNRESGAVAIPCYEPSYFLMWRPPGDYGNQRPRLRGELSICTIDDQRTLLSLSDLDEMRTVQLGWAPERAQPTVEKRFHFFPSAKLLVTLGEGHDELVLRRLDIVESLDKAGLDYLYVSSLPLRIATRGKEYSYRVKVMSKRGKPRYKLESGPEGMMIDPAGRLIWKVPAEIGADKPFGVIVSIKDSSGQEIYHSFNIQVR